MRSKSDVSVTQSFGQHSAEAIWIMVFTSRGKLAGLCASQHFMWDPVKEQTPLPEHLMRSKTRGGSHSQSITRVRARKGVPQEQ